MMVALENTMNFLSALMTGSTICRSRRSNKPGSSSAGFASDNLAIAAVDRTRPWMVGMAVYIAKPFPSCERSRVQYPWKNFSASTPRISMKPNWGRAVSMIGGSQWKSASLVNRLIAAKRHSLLPSDREWLGPCRSVVLERARYSRS